MKNASALVRTSLDNKTRDMLNLTLAAVKDKSQSLAISPIIEVSKLRTLLNAQEVALYHSNQQLIAFSSAEISDALPLAPGDNLFQQIRQKKLMLRLKPIKIQGQKGSLSESLFHSPISIYLETMPYRSYSPFPAI